MPSKDSRLAHQSMSALDVVLEVFCATCEIAAEIRSGMWPNLKMLMFDGGLLLKSLCSNNDLGADTIFPERCGVFLIENHQFKLDVGQRHPLRAGRSSVFK